MCVVSRSIYFLGFELLALVLYHEIPPNISTGNKYAGGSCPLGRGLCQCLFSSKVSWRKPRDRISIGWFHAFSYSLNTKENEYKEITFLRIILDNVY